MSHATWMETGRCDVIWNNNVLLRPETKEEHPLGRITLMTLSFLNHMIRTHASSNLFSKYKMVSTNRMKNRGGIGEMTSEAGLLLFLRAPFIMACSQESRVLKRRCHREPKSHETELRQHRHGPWLPGPGGTGWYRKQLTTRRTEPLHKPAEEASLNPSCVSGFSRAPFCCLTHQQPGDRAAKSALQRLQA